MDRRQFIQAGLLGGIAAISAGSWWLGGAAERSELSLAALLKQLNDLDPSRLSSQGEWNPAQIFHHCAQSIDFSMRGFPQHKSDIFKSSIGSMAFSVFVAQDRMHHQLNEPIPGAPVLSDKTDVGAALQSLKNSLQSFTDYSGKLAPHFAFGVLSKREYEIAHVLHVQNHFGEIVLS